MHLGALDVEPTEAGIAAILPDAVTAEAIADILLVAGVTPSPARGRDNDSVWYLSPRPIRIGRIVITPAKLPASPESVTLTDSTAFGTGHHPTTAMCIEAIEETLNVTLPESILDVGTGSGILALAALRMGVSRATGVDSDPAALTVAAEHAGLNNLKDRLQLLQGGADAVRGQWPLVVANILAAPLIEMAPTLIRRVAHGGRLILSGVASGLHHEVERTYQRLGMRHVRSEMRGGWVALVLDAGW
jgi:ribosomal protein L11 methyltransferase